MTARSLVACLTPPGQGAIATLGLVGPRAWDAVRELFRLPGGKVLPAGAAAGRFFFGRVGEELADEVVLTVKALEPVPRVELHAHGGREVVGWLTELFTARGCERCGWEEFERQTGDPLRARAAAALAQARTVRTAGILLDQVHGAFAAALDDVTEALEKGRAEDACLRLGELAERAALGRRLTGCWRVVVAGAPNVGKSSLVNALTGFERSVVAPTPGTTRDVVTTAVAIGGWPVELVDTAGLRAEAGAVEAQGIRLARDAAAAADLCLWVLDASADRGWPGDSLGGAVRLVINKVDLPAAWDLAAVPALRLSARTGAGLPEVADALAGWLVPAPPPAGAAVPFTAELCAGVVEAKRLLGDGRAAEARRLLGAMRAGG